MFLASSPSYLSEWILGWAALEIGFNHDTASKVNTNFFSWAGKGNAVCPNGADPKLGCFASPGFFNSGSSALFSTANYFSLWWAAERRTRSVYSFRPIPAWCIGHRSF
jgi:hypothetical protein